MQIDSQHPNVPTSNRYGLTAGMTIRTATGSTGTIIKRMPNYNLREVAPVCYEVRMQNAAHTVILYPRQISAVRVAVMAVAS